MMATVMIGNILHDDLDFSKEEIENFFKKDEEGKYNLDDLKDHLNKLGVANISKVEVISEDTKITIVNKDGSTTEVTGKDVNGAYGPNGEIYLSETFLNNATSSAAIAGVINEEFGESMAYQNGYDTAGGTETYGQIFSNNASRDSKDEPIDLDGKATVTGGAIVVNGVDINDLAIRVINSTSGIMNANKEVSNSTNFHNAQDTQEILEDLKRKGIKIIGNKIYFSSEDMLYEYDAKLKDISSDTRKKYVLLYEPITPSGLKMAEEKQEAKKKEENKASSEKLAKDMLNKEYYNLISEMLPSQVVEFQKMYPDANSFIKANLLNATNEIIKSDVNFSGPVKLELFDGSIVNIGTTEDYIKISDIAKKYGVNITTPYGYDYVNAAEKFGVGSTINLSAENGANIQAGFAATVLTMGEFNLGVRNANELSLLPDTAEAESYQGFRKLDEDFKNNKGSTLENHYKEHNKEFNFEFSSPQEYQQAAREFLNSPVTSTTETFVSSEGTYFRYDVQTNEFGIIDNRGGVSTYFKPEDGIRYWEDQIRKYYPKTK